MLTRRYPRFTALTCGLSALLLLATACDSGDDGDDNAGETGGDGDTNSSGNDDSNNTSGDGDSEICEEACVNLESCGISTSECLAFCVADACGTCLANSDSCGEDCVSECAPTGDGDGDPTGDGDGDPTTGDGDGDNVPAKECVINDDCGLSFECVSCNLADQEGWCEQSDECTWDEDCGFGGKCGYNVETGDYRCLPAEYCG